MNTISSKLTAFTAALIVNGMIMVAVGYLFSLQSHPHLSAISFVRALVVNHCLV